MSRRVVVTGLGAICASGRNVPEFWDNLKNGVCGIRTETVAADDELSITTPIAPINDWAEIDATLSRDLTRTDKFSKFAAIAADEAVADSGVDFTDELAPRAAAIIGDRKSVV